MRLIKVGPVLKKLGDVAKTTLDRKHRNDPDFVGYTRMDPDDPNSPRLYVEEHVDAWIEMDLLKRRWAAGAPVEKRIKELRAFIKGTYAHGRGRRRGRCR